MLRRILSSLIALTAANPLVAADFTFCWFGANGYVMEGVLSAPEAALSKPLLTEDDVSAFKIAGYLNGNLIGTWDAAQEAKTWHLRFDTQTLTFLTGGSFPATHSQGWNANGSVDDCGNPGFGFNSGNHAQDVCVNGAWVRESSVAPDTPLTAVKGRSNCRIAPALSKSTKTNHSD